MDDLYTTMMARAKGPANGPPPQAQGQPPPMPGMMPQGQAVSQPAMMPPAPPPNPHTQVPPAMNRFQNGQAIQGAIQNNWDPNPVLLRAMMSRQG